MTVCKTCNGLGKIKLMPFGYICTCAECKGTGETRDYMSNEEWIRNASTEELAEFLAGIDNRDMFESLIPVADGMEDWLKWLQEKHL